MKPVFVMTQPLLDGHTNSDKKHLALIGQTQHNYRIEDCRSKGLAINHKPWELFTPKFISSAQVVHCTGCPFYNGKQL